MGTDFEKKNSNLCGDTADFTPPPPYLVQDFMQSPVIDIIYVHIQSPALAAKKKKTVLPTAIHENRGFFIRA